MANLSLQDFIANVNGTDHLRIERDFGDGFVRLQISEAERRQAAQDIRCSEDVVIELLRNSRDAHAKHVFLAMRKDGTKREFTIIDDGDGIPRSMHRHIFESRVTSKLDTSHMDAWGMHGRGMALYSISVNALSAFVVNSAPDRGTAIQVITETKTLPEKKNQSSFPTFEMSEDGTVNVRGPRNILRTACEFAIDARSTCSVYVGSPAEIAATLYSYGMASLSAVERLFCRDITEFPLTKRLATCGDSQLFTDVAHSMGLEMSTRTARRILDGQLLAVEPLVEQVRIVQPHGKKSPRKAQKLIDGRSFKLQRQDAEELARAAGRAFSEIAFKYYLDTNVNPNVRATRDRITITIPVVREL